MQTLEQLADELNDSNTTEIVLLSEAAKLEKQNTSVKMSSGFADIDGCIDGGFREGDFTVITGIPGEGKTTFARMLTLNFATQGIPSLWFSHEMTSRELWDSFEKMGAQEDLISFVPLSLEDDLAWMLKHCDIAIGQHGVKAIFLDTLGDVVKSVKRQQELSNYATYLAQICKDLRNYAIKNRVMIFTVAHAVKNTRSKSNETDNSDIANSNGIPAAATNIFHIWRHTGAADYDHPENLSYVKIGKSRRNGAAKGHVYKFLFDNNRLVPMGKEPRLADTSDITKEW